jgi:hypothetical protein
MVNLGSADSQLSRGQRRVILLATLVVVTLPVLIAVIRHLHLLEHAVGDQAIIQLHAEDLPARLPLVGVYSRLGFHHPGPMLYVAVAPAVHLIGSFGLVLTAAAAAVASVAGFLIVCFRRGGQVLFLLGALFLIVLIHSMGLDLLSMWNPYVLVMPFALAVALTWSVWCRDWAALPWLALVGSFVAQAHLGLVPAVGFLFASAAARVLISAILRPTDLQSVVDSDTEPDTPHPVDTAGGPTLGQLLASSVILVVTWIPAVIEQMTGDPGNITRILDTASSTVDGQRLGLGRALGLLGLLLGGVDPLRFNDTSDLRILRALSDGSGWWLMVPVTILAVTAAIAQRARLIDQLRLTGLLVGLLVATIVAIASITGLPYLYLARWVVVLNAFIWLNLLWTILSAAIADLDRRQIIVGDPDHRSRSIVGLAMIGSVLLLCGLVPLGSTPGSANDIAGSAAVEQVLDPVRGAIGDCGLIAVAPTGNPEGLLVASGLLVQLRRDGFEVAVDDLFSFSHGEQHSLRGRIPGCTLLVGPVDPDVVQQELGSLVAQPADPGGIGVWLVR